MTAFEKLSPEGKLKMIRQHLDGSGDPVPAPWVEWLLAGGIAHGKPAPGPNEIKERVDAVVAAIAGLIDRMHDIQSGKAVYYASDEKARRELARSLLAVFGLEPRGRTDDD